MKCKKYKPSLFSDKSAIAELFSFLKTLSPFELYISTILNWVVSPENKKLNIPFEGLGYIVKSTAESEVQGVTEIILNGIDVPLKSVCFNL